MDALSALPHCGLNDLLPAKGYHHPGAGYPLGGRNGKGGSRLLCYQPLRFELIQITLDPPIVELSVGIGGFSVMILEILKPGKYKE